MCNIKARDNQFKEVISILNYLQDINMIKVITDLSSIRYDSVIELIMSKDQTETNFTTITSEEFEAITSISSKVSIENLITTYLYIKSCIFKRNLRDDGTEFYNANERPEAFFTRIERICEETGLAKETVNKCLNCLVDNKLLIKHEVGSYAGIQKGKHFVGNSPNIYVLNNSSANQEIRWALDRLKALYKVDSFYPAINRKSSINDREVG